MVCGVARPGLFPANLYAPSILPTVDSAGDFGRYASSFVRAEFIFDDGWTRSPSQGCIQAELFHVDSFDVLARNGSIEPLQGVPG